VANKVHSEEFVIITTENRRKF